MSNRAVERIRGTRPGAIARLLLAAVLVAIAAGLTVVQAPAVQAESSATNSGARAAQTWYAWVDSGERISVDFTSSKILYGNGWGDQTQIVVTAPNGTVVAQKTFNRLNAPETLTFTSAAATTAGVYSVSVVDPNATGKQFGNSAFSWEIDVLDSTDTLIPGRVWTEEYAMLDVIGKSVDLSLWYLTEAGFDYQIDRLGMNGIDSTFTADAFGTVYRATCASAYTSYTFSSDSTDRETYSTAAAAENCAGYTAYKIFFSEPASDLPSSVTLPDGTSTWLFKEPPSKEDVQITDLAFQADAPGSRSGTFTFTVSGNYEGTVDLKVDVDNNGSYNDAVDRTLSVRAVGGTGTVHFDGEDSTGTAIASTTPLSAKVVVDHMGEVHFGDNDVELETGGVQVTRIGDDFGDVNRIYWDDSRLGNSTRCSTSTQASSGASGVDSRGGVDGWGWGTCTAGNFNSPNDAGSYGNMRYIDRWAYVPLNLERQIEIPAMTLTKTVDPETTSEVSVGDTLAYTVTASPVRYAHLENYTTTGSYPDIKATTWSGQYVDDLSDVADNATIDWTSLTSTPSTGNSITDDENANSFTWTGSAVPIDSSVDTTYSVTVNSVGSDSDLDLYNIAYSYTTEETPGKPDTCEAGVCGETENPIIPPTLTLVKNVDNTYAGDLGLTASDWTLTATEQGLTSSSVSGSGTTEETKVFDESYDLAESSSNGLASGYEAGSWDCAATDSNVTITSTLTGATVSMAGSDRVTCTITNTAKAGSVTWSKTDDASQANLLSGSEWTLTPTDPAGTAITVVDNGTNDSGTTVGEIAVKDLKWGTYTLKETKAPAGYVLSDTEYTVTIDGTHLNVHPQLKGDDVTDIVNEQQTPPSLPLTGGMSTDAFLLGGAGLLALAGVGGFVHRRRSLRLARV